MMEAKERGLTFAVCRGKENIGYEQLKEPTNDDIRIAPVLIGSKHGELQTILGVALIVVASIASGGVAAAFAAGAGAWGGVAAAGVAMAAGGIAQMLTPVPRAPDGSDTADNTPSYIFNGAVNTQAQGNPVPLLYGRMIVGSATISAAIKSQFYQPGDTVGPGEPVTS